MPEPMKLMMALEFGSTGELDTSLFHRLAEVNGRNPFKLAPIPVPIALQAVLWPPPALPLPPLEPPELPIPPPVVLEELTPPHPLRARHRTNRLAEAMVLG